MSLIELKQMWSLKETHLYSQCLYAQYSHYMTVSEQYGTNYHENRLPRTTGTTWCFTTRKINRYY